ncbi:MAG: biotin--[acetyl-CoA-carboxylase] ligase [Ahniella sp.]|nr:biotin--[acetyl-CoA-carboxylase] ligase [Ahniella sp.]
MLSEPALDVALIRAALTDVPALELAVVEHTGSTNQDLLRRGDPDASTFVLLAEHQSAGRGRFDRSWQSDAGGSLLVSVSVRLNRALRDLSGLSLAVGVSLAESLRDLGAPVTLKWPNDLQVDGRKLGGILIELLPPSVRHCRVVIGFGLNVRLGDSARAAAGQAVVDLRELGLAGDRSAWAGTLLKTLLADLQTFDALGFIPFLSRFAALDALNGSRVRVGDVEGVASGVDESGRLLVDQGMTVRAFEAGEVSVRKHE